MNIGGQRRIVGRNAKVLEIVQGATHHQRSALSPHQLVCGDSLIRIGIRSTVNELNQLFSCNLLTMSAFVRRFSASAVVVTRKDDGNTWTRFSSQVSRCDSSSQSNAVLTRYRPSQNPAE